MTRVLVISTDIVGTAMAGPGIRAWELSRTLAKTLDVTLAVPEMSNLPQPATFKFATYSFNQAGALTKLLDQAEVVVGQGFVFETHPELFSCELPLAIDLYDPLILESLDIYADDDLATAQFQHMRYQSLTQAQLRRGDFFFCATEIQRDYWLGGLTAMGRITPDLARSTDRDLRMLIDIIPSGIPAEQPVSTFPRLRGVHPTIGQDDMILVWAGGLWDWFDPLILIQAVAILREEIPALRLCFFAGSRPNPYGEPFRTRTYEKAYALATDLNVLNRNVVFLENWVEYDARGAYLIEADAGVSAHFGGVETRLSFRTRLLDYLWARLPVLCTEGDSLGTEIVQKGAGLQVPVGDLEGWITAIRRLCGDGLFRTKCRRCADELAQQYIWESVAKPLVKFCTTPYRTTPVQNLNIVPMAGKSEPCIEQQHTTDAISAIEHPQSTIVQCLTETIAAQSGTIQILQQMLTQREAQIHDLEQRTRWLEEQSRSVRQALVAVEQGRVMRLIRWWQTISCLRK